MDIRMFDELTRADRNDPTIRIVLSNEKDEMEVKYSLLNDYELLFTIRDSFIPPASQELIAAIAKKKTPYPKSNIPYIRHC